MRSSNHNRHGAAVQKRVVIQKRMQFSIVSCSYAAQCLGAKLHETDSPERRPPTPRMWNNTSLHIVPAVEGAAWAFRTPCQASLTPY